MTDPAEPPRKTIKATMTDPAEPPRKIPRIQCTCTICGKDYSHTYVRKYTTYFQRLHTISVTNAITTAIPQVGDMKQKKWICPTCIKYIELDNLPIALAPPHYTCLSCAGKPQQKTLTQYTAQHWEKACNLFPKSALPQQFVPPTAADQLWICKICLTYIMNDKLPINHVQLPDTELITKAMDKFIAGTQEQPTYSCVSCHRLMYRTTLIPYKGSSYVNIDQSITASVFHESFMISSHDGNYWICKTCHRHVCKNNVPPQAKANMLRLDLIPPELQDLHALELRLLAKRIPFMRIISLPKGKQKAIHGPAVNIPASLDPVCTLLPRLPESAHIIALKLKRKLDYKHAYLHNYIRPQKITQALQYLKTHNPLYDDVNINDQWIKQWEEEDPDLWQAIINAPTNQTKPDNTHVQSPENVSQISTTDTIPDNTHVQTPDNGNQISTTDANTGSPCRHDSHPSHNIPSARGNIDHNTLPPTYDQQLDECYNMLQSIKTTITDMDSKSSRTGMATNDLLPLSPLTNNDDDIESQHTQTAQQHTIPDNTHVQTTITDMDSKSSRTGMATNDLPPLSPLTNHNDDIESQHTQTAQQQQDDAEDQAEYDRSVALRGLPFDSCLQQEAFDADDKIYSIAPGEGHKPIPILTDDKFEELANPDKYPYGKGGFTDPTRNTRLTINKYANSRILDTDGRFSRDIDYLMSIQYAVEHKQVQDSIQIAMRQTSATHKNTTITAGQMKQPLQLQSLIHNDKAYRFLRNVRGSPPYWHKMFLETLAMIRQLGIPTWFFTLSAADMQWPEVIQTIAAQYGTHYTADEVPNLPWETKCMWLRSNPVTAARNFNHRLEKFFNDFIKSKAQPLGEIVDSVTRIEFQSRGSPHAHCLLWVHNAPKLGYDDDKDVTSFIDKYVDCNQPRPEHELHSKVTKLQKHSCSARCRRNGKCKYNFGKPPSPETIIAKEPSGPDIKEKLLQAATTIKSVKNVMSEIDPADDITVQDLLMKANVTVQEYTSALATGKKGKTIILKRNPNASHINNYNRHVLKCWKANHDIQYVVDAYACVMYVASYVLKAEKTMGELLKQAAKDSEDQNIRGQLKKAGSVFLTHREVSAQEVVYRVLGLPLRKTSRKVTFINTAPKDRRVRMLLPKDKIQGKDDEDEDVFSKNIIDKYQERPQELEDTCLASFVANYTTTTGSHDKPNVITLGNNMGHLQKRPCESIVRWHNFKKETQSEDYHRSKLMLFKPWRKEDAIMSHYGSYEECYQTEQDMILPNEEHFTYQEGELNDAYQQILENGPPENVWESIAPSTAEEDQQARAEGIQDGRTMDAKDIADNANLDLQRPTKPVQDIGLRYTQERSKTLMSNSEYGHCMRSLNKEQQEIIYHHRQWCKQVVQNHKSNKPTQPYHAFLSGPGGVGKSYVIKMLHNDTVKLLRHSPRITPDEIPILLTAPTGVAAYNINGMTIHSALSMNIGQHLPLSADKSNTLQTQLEQLQVLVIDEISMIGANMLNNIHNRLQEIKQMKHANTRFGNITVIAVGDLYQLPPCHDKKIFATPGSSNNPTMQRLHGSLWQECFKLHELTQVVRQKDPRFITMLNNIRLGTPDIALADQVVTKDSHRYNKEALHLFGTNKECLAHNQSMLTTLNTQQHVVHAEDTRVDVRTRQVTTDISTLARSKTGGLEKDLILATGAKIKLTCNIDVADGLSNGARGEIVKVTYLNGKVRFVLVAFENSSIGKNAKQRNPYMSDHPNAVPVYRQSVSFQLGKGLTVTRTQFPITLAWACTVHSVQGLTVDNIVVNMSDLFDYAHAYVAFSRVKTIEGLQILNDYQAKKIKADPNVAQEMTRLRNHQLITKSPRIHKFNDTWITIGQHNVRGYLPNKHDIVNNKLLCCPNIICITETHLQPIHKLPPTCQPRQHYIAFRCDRNQQRLHNEKGGVAVFVDPQYAPKDMLLPKTDIEHVALTTTPCNGFTLQVIAIYAPQKPGRRFAQQLDNLLDSANVHNTPTVIVGDFNIDLLTTPSNPITDTMKSYHMIQKIEDPTTDYGSLLDHIYHNMSLTTDHYEVIDMYYSDHDATFMAMELPNKHGLILNNE